MPRKSDSQYLSTNGRFAVEKEQSKGSASRSSPSSPVNDSSKELSGQSPEEEKEKKEIKKDKDMKKKKKFVEKAQQRSPSKKSPKHSVVFASMQKVKVIRDRDQESFLLRKMPDMKMKSALKDRSAITTISRVSANSSKVSRLNTSTISSDTTTEGGRRTRSSSEEKTCKCTCFCIIVVSIVISVLLVTGALIFYFMGGDEIFGDRTSTTSKSPVSVTSQFSSSISTLSPMDNYTVSRNRTVKKDNFSSSSYSSPKSQHFNLSTTRGIGLGNISAKSDTSSTVINGTNISTALDVGISTTSSTISGNISIELNSTLIATNSSASIGFDSIATTTTSENVSITFNWTLTSTAASSATNITKTKKTTKTSTRNRRPWDRP